MDQRNHSVLHKERDNLNVILDRGSDSDSSSSSDEDNDEDRFHCSKNADDVEVEIENCQWSRGSPLHDVSERLHQRDHQ